MAIGFRHEIIIIITSDRIRVHHFGCIDNSRTNTHTQTQQKHNMRLFTMFSFSVFQRSTACLFLSTLMYYEMNYYAFIVLQKSYPTHQMHKEKKLMLMKFIVLNFILHKSLISNFPFFGNVTLNR